MRAAVREDPKVKSVGSSDRTRVGTRGQGRPPPGPATPRIAPPADVITLQRKIQEGAGERGATTTTEIHALARAGLQGASGALPYADRIQQAFGRHDISGVRAHTDAKAAGAARGMSARAYTVGAEIAFAGAPSLHTAAHEAAHVIQQRAGVALDGGVGQSGDRYEIHADKVADLVVAGRSAESALDPLAGAGRGASGGAVQREKSEQALRDAGNALRAPDRLSKTATFTKTSICSASSTDSTFESTTGDLTLAAGSKVRIMSQADDVLTIRIFEWNSSAKGWDEFEGTISADAVIRGDTEQTKLGDKDLVLPTTKKGISQKDVYQAGLSDCYLQAALISLAKSRPQDILDMIRDNKNENNVEVRLYKIGIWGPEAQWIRVDRSLFTGSDGSLVYHGKRGAFLWPAFISKAFAVFKGGHSEMQMGLSSEAMFALTGKGATVTRLEKLETGFFGGVKEPSQAFWTYDRIRSNIVADKMVTISTGSFGKSWFKAANNAAKEKGSWAKRTLPSGKVRNIHVYAILDIDPKGLKDGDFATTMPTVRLTLRDPRDEEGGTFIRTLKDIVTAGKFNLLHYED